MLSDHARDIATQTIRNIQEAEQLLKEGPDKSGQLFYCLENIFSQLGRVEGELMQSAFSQGSSLAGEMISKLQEAYPETTTLYLADATYMKALDLVKKMQEYKDRISLQRKHLQLRKEIQIIAQQGGMQ